MRFGCIVFCLILLGCASIKKSDLPAKSNRYIDSLQVKLAYDVCLVRIDIFRQFKTIQVSDYDNQGNVIIKKKRVPMPYHYLGVDLGNGLFLDAHLNLTLNLIELIDLEDTEEFQIVKSSNRLFASNITYTKRGQDIIISHGKLFGSDIKIKLNDNGGAIFSTSPPSSDQVIQIDSDKMVYDPGGVFADWRRSEIVKTSYGAKIPGFWHDEEIVLKNGRLELPSSLSIEKADDHLLIDYKAFFYGKRFTMWRSDKRIAIIDEDGRGVKIDIASKLIKVDYARMFGSTDHEFQIVRRK